MAPDASFLKRLPIAHRGLHDGNRNRWENTMAAFAAAVEAGYGIELDVQQTRDGKAIVFHDEKLERLSGRQGFIHELDASEATALSIGGTGERAPLLAAVLDLVAGKVPLVIELKGNAGHDAGLVDAVASDLKGYTGEVAIMSFAHWHVRKFRDRVPGVPGGLTAEGTRPGQLESHFSMLAHDIAFASFHVDELPNPFVATMRERLGLPVITWTVRNPEQVLLTDTHADQMTFEGFLPPCPAASVA